VTVALCRALLVGFVLAFGWAAAIALDIAVEIYLRHFHIDAEDDLLARKHVTQMRILQRVARTLLAIVTAAAALMTLDSVRQYGVSLFASAGAAGDHPQLGGAAVLSNLLAGIQIAMTQPIRVEDQVVVEGEFGSIETIASNYVVVRLWDLRRMVVPLTYFIEKPFQNWTYERTEQLGSVLLHVDYTVPVDRMSEKLNEIVRQTPLWDGRPDCKLPTRPTTWSNCGPWSARNPGQTWDLRCEVREKLIAFLQAEYPHALPRQRTEQLGIDLELSGGQNRRLRSV
jgi:small-conductance mechanosensitive channel